MKIELKNENFKQDYLNNILRSRGVEDTELYKNTNKSCLLSYKNLSNVEDGVLFIGSYSKKENLTIGLVVDCDCDGYTSAAIIQLYLEKVLNCNFIHYIHEGKQHGLSDVIEQICVDLPDFVICPDSSTNDYEYHEKLKEKGIPVLVLDHHLLGDGTKISDNAIIINNQLSPNYTNKDLTGAGVVYQFCRALDELFNTSYADNFIDLAALGICGDMGSILNLENKYIMDKGFNTLYNPMFISLAEKQTFSMNGKINSTTVAFYIVPLINAMIRVGTIEEKKELYKAFIRGEELIPSKKRGADGSLEKRSIESTRECVNAKSKQQRILEKIEGSIIDTILKEGLNENKILLINLNEYDFPSELNGLLAMRMAERFKRPTLVGRINTDGILKGSIRGLNNSDLRDFRSFLLQSKLFEFVEGRFGL